MLDDLTTLLPGPDPAELLRLVRAEAGTMTAIRRDLHAHPETGLDNPRTQSAVLAALEGLGLDIETGVGASSIIATLYGRRPGRTVLLRADTDALPLTEETGLPFASRTPGIAHACGHDAHTAMLLGAARVLAGPLRNRLTGTVRFVFQPGEEGCGGAEHMIKDGLLAEPTDAAFAVHVNPNLPTGMVATRPGAFFASCDEFEILLVGQGGHASMPHACVDPIQGALALGTALLATVQRAFPPHTPVVVSLGAVNSGTTSNVIPETAVLKGTLRTFDPGVRAEAWKRIASLVDNIARAHRLDGRLSLRYGCPPTVNEPGHARDALDLAEQLLGPGQALELTTPVMAAEDFGLILERVPGALVLVGACPPDTTDPATAAPCHSGRLLLDEECLVTGAALHIAAALAWTRGPVRTGASTTTGESGT
ncbi:M20 family metallopeptidase [Streptomyces sp. P17]|uniref:M20 metallopeptidase family protein n=1 Tax=Streptomyces sp. P17 TaxID=3074716 RepID=UPI0028F40347|nr:M20 family metallopeptidase [Streptomyces sp. P17]MDT9698127.1 M20 family metallopeptidase [Streptomyces sp. P17]